MIHEMYELVSGMNTAFGNPKGDPGRVDWERLQKQCDNIHDEYRELLDGIAARDLSGPEGVRDALSDIQVFTLGGFHFIGTAPGATPAFAVPAGDPDKLYWDGFAAYCTRIPARHHELMACIDARDLDGTTSALSDIAAQVLEAYHLIGVAALPDMKAVVAGVMTRFCQDEADLEATMRKYDELGVCYYQEGEFPTVCLKSVCDQRDRNGENYPKGKFLKSVSYTTTVFPPVGAAAAFD